MFPKLLIFLAFCHLSTATLCDADTNVCLPGRVVTTADHIPFEDDIKALIDNTIEISYFEKLFD